MAEPAIHLALNGLSHTKYRISIAGHAEPKTVITELARGSTMQILPPRRHAANPPPIR